MDSIQRALQNIGRMWAALHATQRVILSASAVLMVVLLVWGSAASAPTWVRVTGPEVTADARATILRKFQEKNQKHEVRTLIQRMAPASAYRFNRRIASARPCVASTSAMSAPPSHHHRNGSEPQAPQSMDREQLPEW